MTFKSNPLGAVARGMIGGAVGTLAMDLVWYARYRRDGGEDRFTDYEISSGKTKGWDDAGAPGQVTKRVVEGLFQRELPDDVAGSTKDATHWATGLGWGALYGLVAGSHARGRMLVSGAGLGATAFATSYLVLGAAHLYQPIWEYDATTLGKDLSAHLVFGLGTVVTFRMLGVRLRRRRAVAGAS